MARTRRAAGVVVVAFALGLEAMAPAAAVGEPWPTGAPLACASTSRDAAAVPTTTTYTDSGAPSLTSLRWQVGTTRSTRLDVGGLSAGKPTGAVAAMVGTLAEPCSGASRLVSAPGTWAQITFDSPGSSMYPLTTLDSATTLFAPRVTGPSRRWCPADVANLKPFSVITRPRYTSFTLADPVAPATAPTVVSTTASTANVEAGLGPGDAPLLRTRSRIGITFSSGSAKKGSQLTVYGTISRLSSSIAAGAGGKAPAFSCGSAVWLPLSGVKATLTVLVPSFKPSFHWAVSRQTTVVTDNAGMVRVSLKFPGLSKYQWAIGAAAAGPTVAPSVSKDPIVVPT